MLSVKDILLILDKIPVWKTLKELPAKVESLEKRVAELEQQKSLPPNTDICPKCKQHPMELISTRPHPTFGAVGGQERVYQCPDCGFSEPRLHKEKR